MIKIGCLYQQFILLGNLSLHITVYQSVFPQLSYIVTKVLSILRPFYGKRRLKS